jgi:hypothetical protein
MAGKTGLTFQERTFDGSQTLFSPRIAPLGCCPIPGALANVSERALRVMYTCRSTFWKQLLQLLRTLLYSILICLNLMSPLTI